MRLIARLGVHIHYVRIGSGRKRADDDVEPKVPSGYETRVVGFGDLLPYVDSVPNLSVEFLATAFESGDECVANFYRGALVGFGFNSRTRTNVTDQLDVLIPEGFRYGYKAWTHADHRRHNLGRMRGYVKRQQLVRPYSERNISYVETHNYASLLRRYRHPRERALAMGFVGWVTFFGRQFPFSSRRAKWVGFEFVRRDDLGVRQWG